MKDGTLKKEYESCFEPPQYGYVLQTKGFNQNGYFFGILTHTFRCFNVGVFMVATHKLGKL